MPDRYWVGGTASWDGTAGTKWSATSGGPGGASVPTTADDVWGKIVPDPGSTWTEVDPSATNTWTEVSPTPGTTWNPVAA